MLWLLYASVNEPPNSPGSSGNVAPRLAFRQLDPRGHSDLWNGLAGESAGNGMSHSASRVSESRAECGVSRSRLRSRHQGNFHRRLDFFTVHGFNQRFGGFHS